MSPYDERPRPLPAKETSFGISVTLVVVALTLVPSGIARALDAKPAVVRVVAATLHRQYAAADLPLTGTVQARILSNIAFQTNGRVIRREVEVGQHVKAGETLAYLEPTEQQTDVTSAEAALDSANAQLLEAQKNFERQQSLLVSGSTTRERFDQALATLRTDEAQVNSAQAAFSTARERLSYTVLRVARDGIIVSRNVEVGQVVQSGQAVFALAEDGPRDAVFQVPEILLTTPPKDRTVDVTLQSMPDVTVAGIVREISPILDQATGAVTVKVGIEQAPTEMTLGSAVMGRARWERSRAFVIPWSALFAHGGKSAVWILDSENKARLREVVVKDYLTGAVTLTAGLEEGERVVTSGVQFLYPGQGVAIAADGTAP